MNECEKFELMASAYIDGEISPSERMDLFGHLAKCNDCAAFLSAGIRLQDEAAREGRAHLSGHGGTPAFLRQGSRISIARLQPFVSQLFYSRLSIPAPIAACLAIAGIVVFLLMHSPTSEPKRTVVIRSTSSEPMVTLPVVKLP